MSRGAATAYMHIPYVVWPWARSSQHISLVSSECHSLACAAPNPGALCTRGGAVRAARFTQPLYVYSSSRHPQKDSRATTYTHMQGGPAAGWRCAAQPRMCMCDAAPARRAGGRRARSPPTHRTCRARTTRAAAKCSMPHVAHPTTMAHSLPQIAVGIHQLAVAHRSVLPHVETAQECDEDLVV